MAGMPHNISNNKPITRLLLFFIFLPSMMSWGAVRVPSDSLVVSLRIRPVSRGKMFLGIPIAVSDGIMPSGASSFWDRCSGSDFHFLCPSVCLPIAQLTTALSPSSVIAAISTSCNRRLTIDDESFANRGSGAVQWTAVEPLTKGHHHTRRGNFWQFYLRHRPFSKSAQRKNICMSTVFNIFKLNLLYFERRT